MEILTNQELISIFLKVFAVVFGFIFLIYAIVLRRQTVVMNRAIKTQRAPILTAISTVQIFVALVLILLAFVFL